MKHHFWLIVILLAASPPAVRSAAAATDAIAALLTPPVGARHFIIHSNGGKHGDSWVWRTADGSWGGRDTWSLRGMVTDTDLLGHIGTNGLPSSVAIRGVTPSGDAAETFTLADSKAQWRSPTDEGAADSPAGRFYLTLGGPTGATNAWFLETLLRQPNHALPLLPSGQASAARLTSLEVGSGDTAQTVTAWAVSGLGTTPFPVWADAQGKFFGVTGGLSWLPEAYLADRVRLEDAQAKAMAARMPALAKALVTQPSTPVAFTHVQTFDADQRLFRLDQTVVVAAGKIVMAGSAAKVAVPANAQTIDGRGKTLLPGLWDVHMHVGDDYTGISELSLGVTSVRDPGNDDRLTLDRLVRIAKGELLSPNVYPSSLIDGRGPFTAQVANVASSEASALELVRAAKAKGFFGVKFYGTFKPEWLVSAIAEAHRLGLHVHGHIPAGMRPLAAIRAGYDEVTHINWIAMQGVPASVLPEDNGILRFEAPGRYAKDFDLDAGPMKEIVDTMAAKQVYSDPTMVAFESIYLPENGELSPSYAPFVGTLPAATERGFRSGGFQVPAGLTRADYRRSWAKMVDLLGHLHRAGVPIVAGTDGSGLELVHELEIYQQAGLTAADALAAATLIPARMLGVDGTTGSIVVGKVADLVLVEGDPSRRLADLRQTRIVMLGGKLLDADALRAAAGFSGRPKIAP
jgi:imidazolonepropionase-like amidohydrolase